MPEDLSNKAAITDNKMLWLRADFEGEVTGIKNEATSTDHSRSYTLHIDNGILSNLQEIDSPPEASSGDELPPLKQALVNNVSIMNEDGQPEQRSLNGFCLHAWRWVGNKEINNRGRQVLVGRVEGTAYFPLDRGMIANQFEIEMNKQGQEQSSPCFICNKWGHAILAALLWIYCDIRAAAIYAGGVAIACVLLRAFPRFEKKQLSYLFGLAVFSVIGIMMQYRMGCGEKSTWLLLSSLIPVLLSFLIFGCLQKAVLMLLWLIAVALWCPACDQVQKQVTLDAAVKSAQHQGMVRENATALFALDHADIRPEAEASLGGFAELLKKIPECNLKIVGHTDQHGENSLAGVAHNYDLSQQRADAVATWLIKHGHVSDCRIRTIGMGAKSPIYANPKNDKEFSSNRRVEIQYSGKRAEN